MKQPSLLDALNADSAMPVALPSIPDAARPLSAGQLRFNALLEQIGTLRREHQRWQTFMDRYRQRIAGELMPAMAQLRTAQTALARLFDEHLARSKMSKRDRELVQSLLIDLLEVLLRDEETPELRTLYEFHTGAEPAEEQPPEFEPPRDHASRQHKRRAKRPAAPPQPPADDGTTALRKVFRRLASTLHPDRESDPQEQRRKTVLMQDLNAAYAAGDLLRILELQNTFDQRAASALGGLTDAELAPYLQQLQTQVMKLKQETDALLSPLTAAFPGQSARSLTEARVEKALKLEIAQAKRIRRDIEFDLQRFADANVFKGALNQTRRARD